MHRSRVLTLVLALGSCAAPAAAPPPGVVVVPRAPPPPAAPPDGEAAPPPHPDVGVYLAADAGERFPKRCLVARRSPVRFTLDDASMATDDRGEPLSHPHEVVVVEEHEHALRFVFSNEHVRLVLFAPRASMQRMVTRAAWLSTAPDRAPDPGAGVRLAPGVALDDQGRQGDVHRVAGEASSIRFQGWLADEAIGSVYVPEPFQAADGEGLLAESSAIVAPTGEVIARAPDPGDAGAKPSFNVVVEPLPGAPRGFQSIHLRREAIEVRGLVPLASYRKKLPGQSVGRLGGSHRYGQGFITDTRRAMLPPGAGIFSAEGERVGVVLAETRVFLSFRPTPGDDSLGEVRISAGPFGFLNVRVRPSDLQPEKR